MGKVIVEEDGHRMVIDDEDITAAHALALEVERKRRQELANHGIISFGRI